MRLFLVTACLLAPSITDAFVTPSSTTFTTRPHTSATSTTARSFGLDPTQFTHTLDALTSSSVSLADVLDTATAAASAATDAVVNPDALVDAAASGSDNGWFGILTGPIAGLLQLIHSAVAATGSPGSWGVSIIILTLLIKVVTFPLTKTQLVSTNKMQAMQPAIKELQTKYQSNPEVMNQKIAEFYQTNEINPLAGCLPSLAQIPIFIGLYRGVLQLAKENKLDESFLWLPSLEGPTYGADPATASDWILKGWIDGAPSLGWDDTLSFMILPVFLVVSQFVSMELMQPKTDDPNAASNNVVLKILPVMIGWFALNVPSALSIYWVTNNIVTTATTLYVRSTMPVEAPVSGGGGAATMDAPAQQTIFTPPREKPSGFGDAPAPTSPDGVKPITAIDAEVVSSDDGGAAPNATPSKSSKKKKRKGKRKN